MGWDIEKTGKTILVRGKLFTYDLIALRNIPIRGVYVDTERIVSREELRRIKMNKVIERIFGKHYVKTGTFRSKYLRTLYWIFVGFYFVSLLMFLLNTISGNGNTVGIVIYALFFPLIFRFINSMLIKFNT